MLFFHDMAIKKYFKEFVATCKPELSDIKNKSYDDATFLIDEDINPYFNWWMRMSATNLKNKINIINSLELRKDLANIESDLQKMIDEVKIITKNLPLFQGSSNPLQRHFKVFTNDILREYGIYDKKNKYSFKNYIINITTEITTYADGLYFGTEEESKERRDELVKTVLTELQNF